MRRPEVKMKKVLLVALSLAVAGTLAYFWIPSSSTDFAERGIAYYRQKKYPEAAIELLNAIRKDGKNRDARYFLSLTYYGQGNRLEAARALRILLETFPDDTEAKLRLGNMYLSLGVDDSRFYQEAFSLAQTILSNDADNVDALLLSGNAAAGLQDYSESAERFQRALSLDPQNIPAFVSLGTSEAMRGNYGEAEKTFLKARETNPKDPAVLASLANFYRAIGEYLKAERVFNDALALYPGEKGIYLQAVEFYYHIRKGDAAERILRDAQAKNSADPYPSLVLYELYQAQNRVPEAEKLILEMKKSFPDNMALAARVAVHFLQSNPDIARNEIDTILKNEPNDPVGYILLGELQFGAGQLDLAERTLSAPIVMNSPFPQPHFFLGSILLQKGRLDQAQDHYQKSLVVDNRYLPARVALAELLLTQGKIEDSKIEIQKVLQSQPRFVPARLVKAALDRSEKKYSEAEQELIAPQRKTRTIRLFNVSLVCITKPLTVLVMQRRVCDTPLSCNRARKIYCKTSSFSISVHGSQIEPFKC